MKATWELSKTTSEPIFDNEFRDLIEKDMKEIQKESDRAFLNILKIIGKTSYENSCLI